MSRMLHSESSAMLDAIRGSTFPEAISRLECGGWKIVEAVRRTEGTFIVTANSSTRHMRLYGKYDRVWTANFGRRND